MNYEQLRLKQKGKVLWVEFLNPPRNLMTLKMTSELLDLTQRLKDDESIRTVVLTGGLDGVFIMHFDVFALKQASATTPRMNMPLAKATIRLLWMIFNLQGRIPALGRAAEGLLNMGPVKGSLDLLRFHQVLLNLETLDKVVIAAINGHCMGGGCETALACDIRFMMDCDALIGQPEILLGLIPGGGGTVRLERAVGKAQSLLMMLDGSPIRPKEAERIGLVHKTIKPSEFNKFVEDFARKVASRPRAAIEAVKRCVNEGGRMTRRDAIFLENASFAECITSKDAMLALDAYTKIMEGMGNLPIQPPRGGGKYVKVSEMLKAWQEGKAVEFGGK